jgi:N-acetylmuramoyl-L-alanine amidase
MSKWFLIWVVSFYLCGLELASAATLNGEKYVSITAWAGANGMKYYWVKHGDILQVSDHDDKLVFDVDSHYAEINGVQVALSFPVADQKGVALIAQFDLDNAVRPLMFPSRYIKPQKITTICLDPGHGGKDTGNRVSWHNEKTYALYLALDVRDELKRAGFKVILTRTKDEYVDLPERPAYANRHGADLFVSLHFNAVASGADAVDGPETYCITPVGAASSNAQGAGSSYRKTTANLHEDNSLLLAYEVQKSLVQHLPVTDRGVRRARFAVLRDATMPAILIEGGYMTNPEEGKKIFTLAYRKQLASAIAKGIIAYQKLAAK